MTITGVHHIAIKARDVQRVAAFYEGPLGLDELDRHHDKQGLRSIWIRCGGAILMVERADNSEAHDREADAPGLHLLALTIEPSAREDWRSRLEAAGHGIQTETEYTLYVQDPEGNRVGLCCLDRG